MFGITDFGAFVIAFVLLLFIPGPGNLAIMRSTTQGGLRGGIAATLGLMAGDQVLMWTAVAGVAALLHAHPAAFLVVQWLGTAYLVWLGAKLLLAKPGDAPVLTIRPRHYFRQALTITVLNPKAIVFYMAFFPLFIDPARQQGLVTFAAMALTVAVLAWVYCMGVVLTTHYLAGRLRKIPLVSRVFEKVAGAFLVGFGIKLAVW